MENECRIKMIDLGRQFQESLPKRTTAASIPVLDDPPGKQWEGLRGGGEVRGLRHALSICVGHRRRHGDGHAGVDNRRCHGDSATSAILGSAKHPNVLCEASESLAAAVSVHLLTDGLNCYAWFVPTKLGL